MMLYLTLLCIAFVSEALACTETTKTLPELERRSRIYRNEGFDPPVNDFYLNDGWYVVNNHVGQYAMPDKIPDYGTCGTNNPIYLQDAHPDRSVLSGIPLDVKACVKDDFDDCSFTLPIKIRLCNDTLRYYLVTTDQFSAYCFDPPELQDILDIPAAPQGLNLGGIAIVPSLHFKEIDQTGRSWKEYYPYLEFKCNFNSETSYFYSVTWYYDGKYIDEYGPSDNIADLSLFEENLLHKNTSLGINIVCGVRVSTDPNGMRTKMETSAKFFAGLKITNPYITLDKSDSIGIELVQTVPIGCHYSSRSVDGDCYTRLAMADPKQYECLKGNIVSESSTKRCGLDLPALKKFEEWNKSEVKHTLKITTKDENYEDRTQYKLHLITAQHKGHQIWREYSIGEIQVSVENTDTYKNKTCYSHIDPHMRTADGRYYENQREGDFMLYRNWKYDIEVQERLIRCNHNKAWCACALGVRVGADIFIINLCQGTVRFINFKVCKDGGTMTVVEKSSSRYEIYTAIGTRIEAVFYEGNTIMNVDITMAPKDIGHTEGLCGLVDGNQSNDFRKRDKTLADSQAFAEDWRLRKKENVFIQTNFSKWTDVNSLFCVCEQAFNNDKGRPIEEAVCAPSLDLECKRKNDDKKRCLKQTRKRRSISNKMTREIERKMNTKVPFKDNNIDKRAVISETEARNYCSDKINNSLAFTKYSDQTADEDPEAVVSQCNFDVMINLVKERWWFSFKLTYINDNGNERMLTFSLDYDIACELLKSLIRRICFEFVNRDPVISLRSDKTRSCKENEAAGDFKYAGYHLDALNTIVSKSYALVPDYVVNNTDEVTFFKENSCPNNCSSQGKCNKEGICECNMFFHGSECEIDERIALQIVDAEGGGVCDIQDGDGCSCLSISTTNLLQNFTCEFSGEITFDDNSSQVIAPTKLNGLQQDIFTGICCVSENGRKRRSPLNNQIFAVRYDISISNNGKNFGNSRSIVVLDSACQSYTAADGIPRVFLKDGFCFIAGQCLQSMASRDMDECQICNPNMNTGNWTNACVQTENPSNNEAVIIGTTVGVGSAFIVILLSFITWKCYCRDRLKKRKAVGNSQTFLMPNTASFTT